MTYLTFLIVFLLLPLGAAVALTTRDKLGGRAIAIPLQTWPGWAAVVLHALIAFIYTTPWDNYLVFSNVWGYAPGAVLGVLGWVPLEEYAFFILQPLLTGLWLLWLTRRPRIVADAPMTPLRLLNRLTTALVALAWLSSLVVLTASHLSESYRHLHYLALICAWALLPIAVQVWYGADILWHYRRLVLTALIPTTLYFALADTIALSLGIWEIREATSSGIEVWPKLPLEEFLFFSLTNLLLVFGITLLLARETQPRIPSVITLAMERLTGRQTHQRALET